jgi:peptidoglycan L-alanyl-D-glutamate endopeptidase CwlK
MRAYSERSLKNLKGVHPDLRRVCDRCLAEGRYDFIVTEGLRTEERQRQMVAQGSSQTMNSRHLTGHAIDVAIIDPDTGKVTWEGVFYDRLAEDMKDAAAREDVDIDWGGDWKSLHDGPHYELNWAAYPKAAFTTTAKAPVPRTSVMQSKTVGVSGGQMVAAGGLAITAFTETDGIPQIMLIGIAGLLAASALWIMRDRLKRWAGGDR